MDRETFDRKRDGFDIEGAAIEKALNEARDLVKALEADQRKNRERKAAWVEEFAPKVVAE